MLKYSPTSSNDASAQLAGQSEPTSKEEEADVDEARGAAARTVEGARAAALLARARGAGRRGVRQRAEDIFSGVCFLLLWGWSGWEAEEGRRGRRWS